ncbi:MAG: bifunctional diaminohydroxyphosphoribosylaminopyrimidine deaminase/5-amino-6-(5-phosphoribosylamino)uracil reductase RibD [Aureliella sp.]
MHRHLSSPRKVRKTQLPLNTNMNQQDSIHLARALELAERGRGFVEPNPMVGCVIADAEGVIAEGFHERCGQNHAERNAIAAIPSGASDRLSGATLYVTLEPCCHHGKTPPCTEAVLASGVGRVVVGMQDPFEKVSGGGIKQLRDAGLEVEVLSSGELHDSIRRLNAPFIKRVTHELPWVIAKWAMSLDGKIATRTGDSQWISGPESRRAVHVLRSQVDAIIVGRKTADVDDPLLTPRGVASTGRTLVRVVVDSLAQLSLTSQLVVTATECPTVVWAGPDAAADRVSALKSRGVVVQQSSTADRNARLAELLRWLVAQYTATNVLVEGGGELLGSLLTQKLIDQCEIFVGPKLIGGAAAQSPVAGLGFEQLAQSPATVCTSVRQLGTDAHIRCQLQWA